MRRITRVSSCRWAALAAVMTIVTQGAATALAMPVDAARSGSGPRVTVASRPHIRGCVRNPSRHTHRRARARSHAAACAPRNVSRFFTQALGAPANLAASPGDRRVSLAWSTPSNLRSVTGYYVYRYGQRLAATSTTSFLDTAVTNGTTYPYYVVSHDRYGAVSARSNTVSATPVASAPPPSSPPSNTSAPTLSGSAVSGQTVTSTTGTWSNSPTSYAYQWYRCTSAGIDCTEVSGATSASYLLGAADVGSTIATVVTAANSGGSSTSASPVTAVVQSATPQPPNPPAPVNTAPPAISGSAVSGQTLTASDGTWSNSPTSYAPQWQRCDASGAGCSAISGASSASYTLGASDVGHTIAVTVTASNAGGAAAADSAPTAVAAAAANGGPGNCTTTISSISQVSAALTPGAVVCLSAGSYGSLSIVASPSSRATLTAAPGAHVVVNGVTVDGSNLTVSQLHSTAGITLANGSSNDTLDHNEVTNSSCGYGIAVFGAPLNGSPFTAVATNDTISGNTIHDTGNTCEADAIRAQGWSGLTVTGNDIYNITNSQSACGGQCHTDTLQSYNEGFSTSGLTITRNYVHDETDTQGLPFLKDGDVSNVTISDNLDVRGTNALGGGEITGLTVAENTAALTITNNTYLDTSGSLVEAYGGTPNPSVNFSHNVFDQFNVPTNTSPYAFAVAESYNVFTANNQWSFPLSSTDSSTAAFACGTSCGNRTLAGDDYRLASNPSNIGIDWAPAGQAYGPGA